MTRVAIIGAGQGGTALLEIFAEDPSVKVVGIADKNASAPGLRLARSLNIPTTRDFKTLLKKKSDIIFNVTGSRALDRELEAHKKIGVEVIGGLTSKLTWALIDEKRKNQKKAEELLNEYLSLYNLSLKLSSNENLSKLYATVINYAADLTQTSAGSLAMFDEERGEMILVASKGFSKKFSQIRRWKIRRGGLTTRILNQKDPFLIEDLKKYPKFDNPLFRTEKIQSLAAISLWNEGKIMGILYVDDFKPRVFSEKEISILSLISTIAATTIAKAKILETTRLLAITDELTGLFNHRHFLQQLGAELSRTKRYERALTLVMLDIDHFKKYNDTHGHLKGNDVLRSLGDIIKRNCRETDIPARYGGEEFTIIMPETGRQKGKILAERLRKAIEDYPFKEARKQPTGGITVSVGVASFPENADSVHDLIEESDRALYRAKSEGRNRVCLASSRLKAGRGEGSDGA